ncbi:MAG: TerD family protein [Selenomonadaceae bacterium]|nr:TerD family protein [Selenomonadaceae bacterium]
MSNFVEDNDIAQNSSENESFGKKFVDREIQRNAFDLYLTPKTTVSIDAGGVLWIYSGVGGIGKTLLFDEFEKLAEQYGKKFVRHDFMDNGTNMVGTLKALRKKLSENYQMEFPLFDKGCICLAKKSGEFVSPEQQKAVLESSSTLRSVKKNISKAFSTQDKTSAAIKAGKTVVDEDIFVEGLQTLGEGVKSIAEGITEITPVVKLGKYVLDFIDKKIAKREQKSRLETADRKGNKSYGNAAKKLEKLNAEDEPAYIKEFLPTLFAQDLSFWLEENNTDLIVFLDTYEVLTGEERGSKKTVRLLSENRDVPVDWWVGKLLAAARVMWIIAGRYPLSKIGEVNLAGNRFVKNTTVDVFDEKWSNEYLKQVGVKEENLRRELYKLTGGHPFYLHTCSITYDNISKSRLPRIKDFGENKDKIIERAVGTLDDNGQYLTQCLCILNRWTDEIAAAVIDNLNNVTYKRIKNLFARANSQSLDDDEIYTFDRTIDAFFFQSLKVDVTCRNLFVKIRDAANVYFKKFFDENQRRWYDKGSKPDFYFGMWSDIILRTTDAPEELMTLYRENLEPLERRFDNSTLEAVVKKFFIKVGDTETLPSAYFQSRRGSLSFSQGRTKEALELATAAYDKVEKISLRDDERPIKISVMTTLADVRRKLKHYTDEIPLREEIVAECENYYPDKRDDRIIDAKKSLSKALENGDRQNEAFAIRRQIFELFDEHDGEKFINAAKSFSADLKRLKKFEEALPLLKKIVAFYETANDDDQKLIGALIEFIGTLGKFSDKEHLEEKAERYRQYFALCQKTERNIPSGQLKDFAKILNKLGRGKDVTDFYKNLTDDLKRRIEAVDKSDKKIVELIKTLVEYLKSAGQPTDARRWENKINPTVNAIVEQTCREPVEDYDAAIATLNEMRKFISNDEEKNELDRKIFLLIERKPNVDEAEIIKAKSEWLTRIYQKRLSDIDKRAEYNRLFDEIEDFYKQKRPASRADFSRTLSEHAEFLYRNGDSSAAVEKYQERLEFLEKDSAPADQEILDTMKKIARIFRDARNYSDELIWREKIRAFCREEGSQETLNALYSLIQVCKQLKDYDKAEQYCRESVAITEKNRGPSNVDTIEENKNLADILHDAGKFVDELNLRAKIVDLWRENFRMNTANRNELYRQGYGVIIGLDFNAAAELDKVGRHDEATAGRIKLLEAINAFLEAFGADDFWTKKNLEFMVFVRRKINGDAQALTKFDELFAAYFKNDDEETSTAENDSPEEISTAEEDSPDETSTAEEDSPEETSTAEEDSPEKISTTEIDTSESLNLRKGQRVPLAKNNSALDKLAVDFRWESDTALEIDASAFLLSTDGKAHADEDFIFYGNKEAGGVKYLDGDGRATMQVELKKISDTVANISFTLTIYDADNRKQNFSGVKISARIVDETTRKEILHFDLTDEFTNETAIVVGEIYRYKGAWRFNAVGAGFNGGLAALCKNFGLEVN